MLNRVARVWVPVVVVVAVALGGLAVTRLRAVFGSDSIFSANGHNAAPLAQSHVKTLTYDLDGPTGSSGSVDYLDEKAEPGQSTFVALPWHLTMSTTQAVVIADLVAQGDGDYLTCRITVDGVVKDEQTSSGHHAHTFCLVKAA